MYRSPSDWVAARGIAIVEIAYQGSERITIEQRQEGIVCPQVLFNERRDMLQCGQSARVRVVIGWGFGHEDIDVRQRSMRVFGRLIWLA